MNDFKKELFKIALVEIVENPGCNEDVAMAIVDRSVQIIIDTIEYIDEKRLVNGYNFNTDGTAIPKFGKYILKDDLIRAIVKDG